MFYAADCAHGCLYFNLYRADRTVLLQSGRSASLGTIAGGAQSLFGKKKGLDEKLSKLTSVLAVTFMLLTIVITVLR